MKQSEAFLQCQSCKKILFSIDFEQNLRVCPYCGHHHRISAETRIQWTFDEGSFEELDTELRSGNPLEFPDYIDKLRTAEQKTGKFDSITGGRAKIMDMPVSIAVADFSFMGGSMGSVAGEKITRCLERAANEGIPAIIFCASGGARMQEGILSLMQMAKTTAAVQRCREAGVPYIAVFTDPTMAGVLASYASVADVIVAEPKALVGFAGARVSKQAGVSKVPDDFQTAEFCLKHGMIDAIVPRKEMRATLASLVRTLGGKQTEAAFEKTSDAKIITSVKKSASKGDGGTAAKSHKEWESELTELEIFIANAKERARKEQNPSDKALLEDQITKLEDGRDKFLKALYANVGDWEKVLIARAEKRPYTLDYITALFQDFTELQGDRNGFIDNAIVGGPALFEGRPVMVIGHQKGRNIHERQFRNFGMAKPEGYRKAIRLFEMAERFNMPIVTFVDTPAADPGVESESRGISEAIAASIMKMFELSVPTVSIVIGEGGSGGAIGIAAASKVLMLQYSVYSVIPPEGCAAILWRMPERGAEAARALKLTAENALSFGLIDGILPEPVGGAHRNPIEIFATVKEALVASLGDLETMSSDEVREARFAKFRKMGQFDIA